MARLLAMTPQECAAEYELLFERLFLGFARREARARMEEREIRRRRALYKQCRGARHTLPGGVNQASGRRMGIPIFRDFV